MLKYLICSSNIISKQKQQLLLHTRSFASYYITTPIFYVNSSPHVGHVYTLLVADALNIYNRLKLNSKQTILSSGTDEHGIKIQNAADLQGIDYREFCDINSNKFYNLFKVYDTTLTEFTRTSSIEHIETVKSIWQELNNKDYIYKSTYSGWYCSSNETFVPESQVTKKELNGIILHVDQNDNEVNWSSEENYMFRLNKFIDQVLQWLIDDKPLVPDKFNTEAISMIKRTSDFADISISRPKKRLKWGIEVPNDSSQTIYVWLDALTNYLTVVGYNKSYSETKNLKRWPIDCQVIGKDIIKFHAIYWPAFLLALSLPLPKKLLCHSHWLVDSLKMSKSRGNVIDPNEENKLLTIEGLRYYLLRCATPHSDTDYNRTQAIRRINSELADTYGNLLSRCCSSVINPDAIIPTNIIGELNSSKAIDLKDKIDDLCQRVAQHYENADFYKGLDEIMSVLRLNNSLYEDNKPWKLIKEVKVNETAHINYLNLQAITFETLRICSILMQPIIPKTTTLALNRINAPERSWNDARLSLKTTNHLVEKRHINSTTESVIFRRLKV